MFFLQRFRIRFLETDSFSSFNVLRELITLFRFLTLSSSSSICGLDQRPSLELSNLFFELSRLSFFSICLPIFSATLEFASFSIPSNCSKYPKTHCLSLQRESLSIPRASSSALYLVTRKTFLSHSVSRAWYKAWTFSLFKTNPSLYIPVALSDICKKKSSRSTSSDLRTTNCFSFIVIIWTQRPNFGCRSNSLKCFFLLVSLTPVRPLVE